MIRAKVVGEKEVISGNDIYGNPIKRIQYDVKQIKVRSDHPKPASFLVHPLYSDVSHVYLFQMFKGPDQDIEAVLTAPVSAVCGVTLDANGKKEYLISGTCWQDQTRFFRKTNPSRVVRGSFRLV